MEENLTIYHFFTAVVTLAIFIAIYLGVSLLLGRKKSKRSSSHLWKQSILFLIVLIGSFVVVFSLPLNEKTRSDITELLGYVISAIVALSSATIFGNILAGILLRIINNFKPGDFIEVGEHFGRISERGLFHTEMQTNDRNLITLPNLYLAVNPVKVTRSTGTFISTTVSLGYDVSRLKIEQCLVKAAESAGLTDAFVYITELGDYSVVYKIHGKQEDIKRVLSATSRLNAMVLDKLHEAKIEIVSPTFMNQRQVGDANFIPKNLSYRIEDLQQNLNADLLVFDKAEQAETIEQRKVRIDKIQIKIKELKENLSAAKESDKEKIKSIIKRYADVREKMEQSLAAREEEFKEENDA